MANDNETVEQLCEVVGDLCSNRDGSFETIYGERVYATLLADRILAAHKRELAAKDAEIEDLKAKNTEAFKAVLKRDALIKELADALEHAVSNRCITDYKNKGCKYALCVVGDWRSLVAKAREAVGVSAEEQNKKEGK